MATAPWPRIARHDGGQTMQNQITTALIIALAVAFIAAAVTCTHTKRTGELRTKEAQTEAENWQHTARAYAEALARAEEARRRAEQSTRDYLNAVEDVEARHGEAEQELEELRTDAGACVWLDEHLPDGVRDIIGKLYARPGCD